MSSESLYTSASEHAAEGPHGQYHLQSGILLAKRSCSLARLWFDSKLSILPIHPSPLGRAGVTGHWSMSHRSEPVFEGFPCSQHERLYRSLQ